VLLFLGLGLCWWLTGGFFHPFFYYYR